MIVVAPRTRGSRELIEERVGDFAEDRVLQNRRRLHLREGIIEGPGSAVNCVSGVNTYRFQYEVKS